MSAEECGPRQRRLRTQSPSHICFNFTATKAGLGAPDSSGMTSMRTLFRGPFLFDWTRFCLHSETTPGGERHLPPVSSSGPGEGRNVSIWLLPHVREVLPGA